MMKSPPTLDWFSNPNCQDNRVTLLKPAVCAICDVMSLIVIDLPPYQETLIFKVGH